MNKPQQKRGVASPKAKEAGVKAQQKFCDPDGLCGNRDVTFKPGMWVTWRPEYRQRMSAAFDAVGPFKLSGVEASIAANDPAVHHQRLYMKEAGGLNGIYLMPLKK